MSGVGLLLFFGMCVGHLNVMVFLHNLVYGSALPHRLQQIFRVLDWLIAWAGPFIFLGCVGLDPIAALLQSAQPLTQVLALYGLICAFIGLVVFPTISLRRWLRVPPAALLSNHSEVVDVAATLGYKPIGRGKHNTLARLPGNQIFQVEFSERTLALPDMPAAWDGLTILHLSDTHFKGTPDRDFFVPVMDRCRAWNPDVVALTGDVVDSKVHHRWIVPLLGRLRWRIAALAILGNHDGWRDVAVIRRRLKRLNMRMLDNRWETLDVRGEPMVVVGHEGPWFRPPPDLSDCPSDSFRLCLSHTPDNIGWARRHGIQLMLSGHNHGGQIRFPVIGSVFTPSLYGRRFDCGTFQEGPTLLHVSRGLAGQHPVRYNCRPEVTLLTLRRG